MTRHSPTTHRLSTVILFYVLLCRGLALLQAPLGSWDDDATQTVLSTIAETEGDEGSWGLSTYANVPFVPCQSKSRELPQSYDIAILGAPFDTVSYA